MVTKIRRTAYLRFGIGVIYQRYRTFQTLAEVEYLVELLG